MSDDEDRRVRAAAGPGKLGQFIRDAVMRAVKAAEVGQRDEDADDDEPRRIFE